MHKATAENLKAQVKAYWNEQSCDTWRAKSQKYTREYFDEIEHWRYDDQPFVHSFAQFTRYHGKRVLEVGFGAGTDFIQWLRAGAIASGIDLTEEALANLTHCIDMYGLPKPEKLQVADAEHLPFESDSFDLGYSYGVLHHTPNTEKALRELVRAVRPGGEVKVMLYNRFSLCAFIHWIKYALLKGRPWKSFYWVLWNHLESAGTKAYTRRELRQMLAPLGLTDICITTHATSFDRTPWKKFPFSVINAMFDILIALSRNRLGFFHCITARKQ